MAKYDWKRCVPISAAAFVLFLLVYYWQYLSGFIMTVLTSMYPLVIGGMIAYAVNIPMCFIRRHYFPKSANAFVLKSRKPVSIVLSYLIIASAVAAVMALVVPELVGSARLLLERLPGALGELKDSAIVQKYLPSLARRLGAVDWAEALGELYKLISGGAGDAADEAIAGVGSVFSSAAALALGFIFSAYFLGGKERLHERARDLAGRCVPEKHRERLSRVMSAANQNFHRFIVGQCSEAVILGVLCALGMLLLGFPHAVMIGALVGFTALIPVAGAYVGAAVGGLMMLTVSPLTALEFIIFIVVLQQLEGNLIYPRIVGKSIGLPPFLVLTAIILGGGVGGIFGMLLAVPLMATAYQLICGDKGNREAV